MLDAHTPAAVIGAPQVGGRPRHRVPRVCREALSSDPFSGTLFVFRNRRRTALKLLVYDGQGLWLCMKRLSGGRFRYRSDTADGVHRELLAHQLQVLLAGGNAEAEVRMAQRRKTFRARAA